MTWIKNHKVLLLTVVVAIIAAITSDTTHSLIPLAWAGPVLVILNLVKAELSGAQVAKLKAKLFKAGIK